MKRTLQRQRQIQGGIDINVKTTQNISKIKQDGRYRRREVFCKT